jgi:hypothetical protein
MRFALLLFMPVLFAVLAEAALRLCGYGFSPAFLVQTDSGTRFATNDKFARRYFGNDTVLKPFAFSIPKKKPDGSNLHSGRIRRLGNTRPGF